VSDGLFCTQVRIIEGENQKKGERRKEKGESLKVSSLNVRRSETILKRIQTI
jgi:hypothetical protein